MTWASCALVVAVTGLFVIGAVFVGSVIAEDFATADVIQMVGSVLAGAAVSLSCCGLASWCAWRTWHRRAWARNALAALALATLVVAVIALSLLSIVVVPGSAAVLILLALPRSTVWFRSEPTG